jgi:hypothetical protein
LLKQWGAKGIGEQKAKSKKQKAKEAKGIGEQKAKGGVGLFRFIQNKYCKIECPGLI